MKFRIFDKKLNDRMLSYYMDVALRTSALSRARRLQVGCIIVKDENIISYSWNGTPRGFDNNCEHQVDGGLKTKDEVVHAEINALSKVSYGTHSSKDASMFLTHSPCYECSKAIIQSGIKEVYYQQEFRDIRPIEFLKQAGIKVHCTANKKRGLKEWLKSFIVG